MSPDKKVKVNELRELAPAELQKKLHDLRQEIVRTRIAKANQQLKNPLKLRELRHAIARVLTVIKEKSRGTK